MKRLAILLALAGCATPPEKIAAVQMSGAEYAGMSCAEMGVERARLAESLAVNVKHQKDTVTADALGVILLGVPTGSLAGGDKETYIAVEKGRLAAIERVIGERC